MPDKTYDIIYGLDLAGLVNKVNDAILEGWKPLGGVTQVQENTQVMWAQAMIRNEEGKNV